MTKALKASLGRPRKVYLAPDGMTPCISIYMSNFPESLFIEVKDYQIRYNMGSYMDAFIDILEKGLGKKAL